MPSPREQPTAFCSQGVEKYGPEGLLLSAADRGWSGLQAEFRRHGQGVIAWRGPQPDTEICVDVCGNGSIISRHSRRGTDRAAATRGTVWLSAAGPQEGTLAISDPVPGILHIYLPSHHFSAASLGIDCDEAMAPPLRTGSVRDPLLAEMAFALLAELETETSAGRLLADTLASSLAARLVQRHLEPSGWYSSRPGPDHGGLDRGRLRRVLDYIEANLEGELRIEQLASVACLSRFHFARAFKAAVGRSPHQYVSARRLDHAKTLLTRDDRPLADIALALEFSCQASFTRAFARATGQTPGRYRRRFRPG